MPMTSSPTNLSTIASWSTRIWAAGIEETTHQLSNGGRAQPLPEWCRAPDVRKEETAFDLDAALVRLDALEAAPAVLRVLGPSALAGQAHQGRSWALEWGCTELASGICGEMPERKTAAPEPGVGDQESLPPPLLVAIRRWDAHIRECIVNGSARGLERSPTHRGYRRWIRACALGRRTESTGQRVAASTSVEHDEVGRDGDRVGKDVPDR
jgi:hypothetical protein